MLLDYKLGQTSIVLRVKIYNSSVTTGAGLTGLTSASTGMIISTIADNEAAATVYTVAGSLIDTIATLGTFAAPTATHCRFKEVDATNHKGIYEIQIADARFAAASAKSILISISGATNAAECDVLIPLRSVDPYDAVHFGISALPNTACTTNASLLTSGSGTDQLSVASGKVILQATQSGVTIPTVTTVTNQLTAAAIATGVWQDTTGSDFTTASSIGKSLYTSGVAPGAAGGLFIAGTNAATTVTTAFTTTFTGNLTGSVASVTGAVGSVTGLTTATIATAVWTDTTGSDFTTTSSPGKILVTQLGGTFSTTSSSIFTGASLVNSPASTDPWLTAVPGAYAAGTAGYIIGNTITAAAVATAVWQDAVAGDFTAANSIGKCLYTAGIIPGAAGGHFIAGPNSATTVNITGNLSGSVGSVTGLTTATIATAIWTDTTGGDFTTTSSPGKIIVTQLGGAFTNTTGSVLTIATLANSPAGVDPWSTALPGSYAAGTAGYQLGHNLTAADVSTTAQLATAVWQDTTAGDFTTASSIGKSLYTAGVVPGASGGLFLAGTNAATTVNFTGNLSGAVGSVTGAVGSVTGAVGSVTGSVGSVTGAVGSVTGAVGSITGVTFPSGFSTLTAAAIATAVWTDTTAGDFTTTSSPGKILVTQLGGSFTTTSSSVYTTASLVNAPTGSGGPTAAAIATAVWQDATGSDFTTASSIGKSLYTAGIAPGASGGLFLAGTNAATTVNFTGNLSGSVGSVTGSVGSVTGSVGSVTGAVGSVTGAVGSITGVTFPSGFSTLTTAAIATGVWQDTTSGDFTTSGSIGKSLFTAGAVPGASGGLFLAGTNATTTVNITGNLSGSVGSVTGAVGSVTGSVGSVTGSVGSVTGAVGSVTGAVGSITGVTFPSGFNTLTNAAIATAVWTDTTGSDFTTTSSPGKILVTQLGTAFTTTSSSVFTVAAMANAPTGTGGPTLAAIASAVWQDAVSSDFTTSGSIGKSLFTSGAVPGGSGGLFIAGTNAATTANITGNLSGSVGSVTGNVGGITSVTFPSGFSGLTSTAIATAVWQDTTGSDFTTASSIGKSLYTAGAVPGASGGLFLAGSNAATTVNFTGNLSGSVGSVTGAVGSVTGAVGSVTGAVGSITGVTFPSGFSTLTTAAIATGVWQDTTAGDFTTAASIGKSLFTGGAVPGAAGGLFLAGTNAATTVNITGNLSGSVGSVTGSVGSVTGAVGSVTGAVGSISGVTFPSGFSTLTTGTIATSVWTDTTGSDFTIASSPGKILTTQLGGAFTNTTGSIFSTAALANAGGGGGGGSDPWLTALPGAYTAGQAGYIVGHNLDGTVSSRMATFTLPANFSSLAIDGTGLVTLAAAGLDQVSVESGVNARQALAVVGSACGGLATGLNTHTPVYKGLNNNTTRIQAVTDSSGNRNSVILTLP